ncbi:LPD7 domain-containing protein [Azohydromonas aeria]|uniref:LPD7 domain-containing protein n=1 Tax=Azohydromonas aeria TaxID=2590212 RepID=UPI0012FC1178|nr:LPD7 domain-containing protein [Azohydromonas aeria]
MERHLNTRWELTAEGRDSRTFIDPQRAGAAFFDAKREDRPQLLQHDVYSIDGGNPKSRHTVIALTGQDPDGAPSHRLVGMPAEVRQGYEEAAQRTPVRAIPVTVEEKLQPDPLDAPVPAAREPMELALHEAFVLEREGHQTRYYGDAFEAGAAFFTAPITQKPKLLHVVGDQEPREVGTVNHFVASESALAAGVYLLPHKEVTMAEPVDADVRAGFFGAMERSVADRLAAIDLQEATHNGEVWRVPKLEPQLYGDLQALTLSHRELALQAWLDNFPDVVKRPTFMDLKTGQVATLDRTADMSVVPEVVNYVYRDAEVVIPPHTQDGARYAPAQGVAAMVVEQQSKQQPAAPAPTEAPMEGQDMQDPQTRPAQRMGVEIGALKFEKSASPSGTPQVSYEALDKAGGVISKFDNVPAGFLHYHVGSTLAERIDQAPDGRGKLIGNELQVPVTEKNWSALVARGAAPTVALDGKAVTHLEFHKYRNDDLPQYQMDVRAIGPDGTVVKQGEGIVVKHGEDTARGKLAELLGGELAKALIERPDSSGRLLPQELPSYQPTAEPAPAMPLPQAAPAKAPEQPPPLPPELPPVAAAPAPMAAPAPVATPAPSPVAAPSPAAAAAPAPVAAAPAVPRPERIAQPLQIDGETVTRLTFTKTQTPRGLEFAVRAHGSGALPLVEYEGLAKDKLAEHFGQQVADAIDGSRGRSGTLSGDKLQTLGSAPAAEKEAPSTAAAPAPAAEPAPAAVPPVLNSIEAGPPRAPEKSPAPQAATPEKDPAQKLFDSLAQRFEIARLGTPFKTQDEYRIMQGNKLQVAFTDHGKRLSTPHDSPEVVKGMADLAQAKGWHEINANGTLEFRRAIWMEGNLRGIHVTGFEPSPKDHERLAAERVKLHQPVQAQAPTRAPTAAPENSVDATVVRQPEKPPTQAAAQPEKAASPGSAAKPKAEAPEKAAQKQQQAAQPAQDAGAKPGQATGTREQYLTAARAVLQEQGVIDKATIDRAIDRMGIKVDAMLAAGHKLPPIHVVDRKAPSVAATPQPVAQPLHQPSRGHEMPAPGQ